MTYASEAHRVLALAENIAAMRGRVEGREARGEEASHYLDGKLFDAESALGDTRTELVREAFMLGRWPATAGSRVLGDELLLRIARGEGRA